MQQRQDSEQRFVRVDGGVGCPPAEQVSLLFRVNVCASEALSALSWSSPRVGSMRTIRRLRAKRKNWRSTVMRWLRALGSAQECLDVVHVHQ